MKSTTVRLLINNLFSVLHWQCLNLMFKVSAFLADTAMQTLSPLADCSVNDMLIKAAPYTNQSFFQMVDHSTSVIRYMPLYTRCCKMPQIAYSHPDWDRSGLFGGQYCGGCGPTKSGVSAVGCSATVCEHGEPWHCLVETWRKVQILNEWLAKNVAAVACSSNLVIQWSISIILVWNSRLCLKLVWVLPNIPFFPC